MKREKIIDLAEDFHRYTDYETETTKMYGGETIVTQHKIWAFTEEQLIEFAEALLKTKK